MTLAAPHPLMNVVAALALKFPLAISTEAGLKREGQEWIGLSVNDAQPNCKLELWPSEVSAVIGTMIIMTIIIMIILIVDNGVPLYRQLHYDKIMNLCDSLQACSYLWLCAERVIFSPHIVCKRLTIKMILISYLPQTPPDRLTRLFSVETYTKHCGEVR